MRLLSLAFVFLLPSLASGEPREDSFLSRLPGRWVSDDGHAEEAWSPLSGDNLVGSFRLVKDGKAKFYELLVIQRETNGTVMRIRHFDRDLSPWEKEGPMAYRLVQSGEGTATFENSSDKVRRIVYEIEGARLLVRLERATGEKAAEFRFSRR
jgi:Domain of unknown function (DUF6265)